MHIAAEAIVCAVIAHGEHGAVVRVMTPDHGLQAGYVRGGRSRRIRPILMPGNQVAIDLRSRTDTQLGHMTIELVHSRAPLLPEPLAATAIDWATSLAAVALPEGLPYPRVYDGLDGVLAAIEAAPAARGWAVALVRFELLILAELGFGLDLSGCVATGRPAADADLAWISPKSGGAVGRDAGNAYADRLFPLPHFLLHGGEGQWDEVLAGLKLTGHFLRRDLLVERRAASLDARDRMIERIRRIID